LTKPSRAKATSTLIPDYATEPLLLAKVREDSMSKVPAWARETVAMTIEPEDIVHLVQEMTRLHDEGRGEGRTPDMYSAIGILAERHRGDVGKPACIMQRMRCLEEVMKDSRMRGWSFNGPEEGCKITSEAVFRATAICPLKATSKRLWFDADNFFEIVLRETDSEGNA
jgi:hypothetical protein